MTERHLSGELKFDVEALFGVAPKYSQASGWIDNGLRDVTNSLLALGDFWGTDEAGTKFGNAYQPQQSLLLKFTGMLAGELEGVSEGIFKMAKNYGITEDGLSAKIRSLNSELPN
jgi:hypothetical protein